MTFFGVAEPVMHYVSPPTGTPETIQICPTVDAYYFFPLGIACPAIYVLVGLSLAYFSFRHNLPLKVRSGLYPIIGKRIYGPIGDGIDTFATIGTIFGIATTLGFGVTQISSGLNYLFDFENSIQTQVDLNYLSQCARIIFSFSWVSDKGIKRLSELNIILAVILLAFGFFGQFQYCMFYKPPFRTLVNTFPIYLQ